MHDLEDSCQHNHGSSGKPKKKKKKNKKRASSSDSESDDHRRRDKKSKRHKHSSESELSESESEHEKKKKRKKKKRGKSHSVSRSDSEDSHARYGRVDVVYRVTIVAIVPWVVEEILACFGSRLHSTHCREFLFVKLCRPAYFVTTQLLDIGHKVVEEILAFLVIDNRNI